MYGMFVVNGMKAKVAGPCEFLVMYGDTMYVDGRLWLQDPVNF